MPIVNIPDEVYESLDDSIKTSLKTEDIDGLKSTAERLLTEKKTEQAKNAGFEATIAQLKADVKEAGLKSGKEDAMKIQEQLQDALSRIEQKESENIELRNSFKARDLKSEAQKIAASLTKDTGRMDLLSDQILTRIDIDGDRLVVLDPTGAQTISTVAELTDQIKTKYPFLIDGSGAAGGNSKGGSGGAANVKKFSEMSLTEKTQLANSDPKLYAQLSEI